MDYGEVLEIKKDSYKQILKKCSSKCDTASNAFDQASQMIKLSSKNLFKQIELIFPELKKYHYNYYQEKQVIIVKELKDKGTF